MMNNLPQCPRCQSHTEVEASFCSRCGQSLRVLPPPPLPPQPTWQQAAPIRNQAQVSIQAQVRDQSQIGLHIIMPAKWHLVDTDIDIFFDGQHIGRGSFNQGFDLRTTTTAGSHVIDLGADVMAVGGTMLSAFSTRQFHKTWKLPLGVPGFGERVATIKYSRAWGTFKVEVG